MNLCSGEWGNSMNYLNESQFSIFMLESTFEAQVGGKLEPFTREKLQILLNKVLSWIPKLCNFYSLTQKYTCSETQE